MKIKKGDTVKILLGKDRGKTGKVERVFIKENKVLVGGINLYKRHLKPRSEGEQKQGGIVSIGRPILVSKVALICPKCKVETRVGYQVDSGGKVRICRKCQAII